MAKKNNNKEQFV